MIQQYGTLAAKHTQKIPNYHEWGIASSTKVQALMPDDMESTYKHVLNLIDNSINVGEYQIVTNCKVSYYQGKELPDISAIWIRLERKNSCGHMDGEHISLVYHEETKQLLGYTRMQADLVSGLSAIDHQTTLDLALLFLKKVAPDLVNPAQKTPQLISLTRDEGIIFNPALVINNVELQWIDEHLETINLNNQNILIGGLKVKMYLPHTKLWAWVIVDKYGRIITFERNVSWDFTQMQRQTQMWLHDKWLITHKIIPSTNSMS